MIKDAENGSLTVQWFILPFNYLGFKVLDKDLLKIGPDNWESFLENSYNSVHNEHELDITT